MSQLRRGVVAVQNLDATVRGVYAVKLSGVVGTFLTNEDITWGASGVGKVVDHDTVAQEMLFYRVSGAVPVSNDGIQNSGGTKSATLNSFLSTSCPNFATELAGGAAVKVFSKQLSGIFYNLSATIGPDSFVLTAPYQEASNLELAYTILRDGTANFGWHLTGPTDVDLGAVSARNLIFQDATLFGSPKITAPLTGNWLTVVGSAVEYWKDADRTVHLSGRAKNAVDAVPSTIFTLPAGYRPASGQKEFPAIISGNSQGVVIVTTAGLVRVVAAGSLSVSVALDAVHFRAEA